MATQPHDPIKMYENAVKAPATHPSIEALAKKEKPPQHNHEMPGPGGNAVRRAVERTDAGKEVQNKVADRANKFVVSKEDVQLGKKKMLEPEFSKAHDGRNI